MARAPIRGSRAVESYLRNFEGEKTRYQEILEITLCYGVQCLARTYSLKGLSCNELRTITDYDRAKNRDFYVRNASRTPTEGVMQRTPVELRPKPSHSWRDGEEDMPDFSEPGTVKTSEARGLLESARDLLGVYASRDAEHLEHEERDDDGENSVNDEFGAKSEDAGQQHLQEKCQDGPDSPREVKTASAAMRSTHSPLAEKNERKQRSLHQQKQKQSPPTPRHLQHVKSKLQPELNTRRQKILRVKTTQSQRVAETLARARLAEYDARRELQDVRERRLGPKKMSLNEITKGAAALEIADDFVRSSLMDKFGNGNRTEPNRQGGDLNQERQLHNDPLKEELYGTTALDESFLGCKPAPKPQRRKTVSTRPKRNYNGWLGDFGPLHTKTVRPEWDEADTGANDTAQRAEGSKFEWNFEYLPDGRHETVGHHKARDANARARFESEDTGRVDIDLSDDASDSHSVNSDPVFRWLKDAV